MAEHPQHTRRSHSCRRTRRRGYTLVFFAMMMFGIMAMAALVIDIGFARLAQRQMQSAAGSAAIEGLRFRDELPPGYPASANLDEARRQHAGDVVTWIFDDDFDASGAYPTDDDGAFDSGSGQFGAGPLVAFSGGEGDPSLSAGQFMEVDPSNPVYKPQVLDGAAAGSTDQFVVTLQRGVATVPDADLYSAGPAVPYLFARGSFINRQLIDSGISVLGTAEARPAVALSIGIANDALTLPGLVPLALELDYWNNLTTGTALEGQAISSEGEIGTAGRFFTIETAGAMPLTVGRSLPDAAVPPDDIYIGYVPIYMALASTSTPRVVGFGEVQVVATDGGTMASITRQTSRVAAKNVSAVRCYSTDLSGAEAAEVYSLVSEVAEPLLAPSLRSDTP